MTKQEWIEYFELMNNREPTKAEIDRAINDHDIILEAEIEVPDVAKEVTFSRKTKGAEKLSYSYGLGYVGFFKFLIVFFTCINILCLVYSIYHSNNFVDYISGISGILGILGIILGIIGALICDFFIKIYANVAIIAKTNTDIRNKLYGVTDENQGE